MLLGHTETFWWMNWATKISSAKTSWPHLFNLKNFLDPLPFLIEKKLKKNPLLTPNPTPSWLSELSSRGSHSYLSCLCNIIRICNKGSPGYDTPDVGEMSSFSSLSIIAIQVFLCRPCCNAVKSMHATSPILWLTDEIPNIHKSSEPMTMVYPICSIDP